MCGEVIMSVVTTVCMLQLSKSGTKNSQLSLDSFRDASQMFRVRLLNTRKGILVHCHLTFWGFISRCVLQLIVLLRKMLAN